jgi:hypothetical protein
MSCRLSPDVHPGVLCLISWLFATSALVAGKEHRAVTDRLSGAMHAYKHLHLGQEDPQGGPPIAGQ